MNGLRLPGIILFGLMLSGCLLLEVLEACMTLHGEEVALVLDAEAEESEENSEEEREGPEEKEGKGKFEALLEAQRQSAAAEAQRRHNPLLSATWKALVTGRIWEPPERG